jgi:hypothetical protein
MSCTYHIQDQTTKQEQKHNANMPWSLPQVKTTMESDVLAVRKTPVAESLTLAQRFRNHEKANGWKVRWEGSMGEFDGFG